MIKQFIPQEFCLKCQGCCRFNQEDSIWSPCLLDEEIEILLKHGLPPSLITPHKKIRVVSFGKENIFICALFNAEENKCKIYEFRPFECQLYPLLINRKGKEVFLAVDLKCPFVKENLQQPVFKEYAKDIADLFHSPQGQSILSSNPQIIQEYSEVMSLSEIKI